MLRLYSSHDRIFFMNVFILVKIYYRVIIKLLFIYISIILFEIYRKNMKCVINDCFIGNLIFRQLRATNIMWNIFFFLSIQLVFNLLTYFHYSSTLLPFLFYINHTDCSVFVKVVPWFCLQGFRCRTQGGKVSCLREAHCLFSEFWDGLYGVNKFKI